VSASVKRAKVRFLVYTHHALNVLSLEATSLLDQAKLYLAKMDALSNADPSRAVYEKIIRDLLQRSRRLSAALTVSVSAGADASEQ
jgi:hypothetical protein